MLYHAAMELKLLEKEPEVQADLPYTVPDFVKLSEAYVARPAGRKLNRNKVGEAFQDAFELVGGVPRLALWAHAEQTEFYRLYSKLLPSEQKIQFDGKIEVIAAVRPTALDREPLEHED